MQDFRHNSIRRRIQYKNTGWIEYDEFYPRKSKPIIDEIDHVLAHHYGFTDEELDFIINYDIKYRMGRDAEEEGEDEGETQEAESSKQKAVVQSVATPVMPAEAQAGRVPQAAPVAQAVSAVQSPTFVTLAPERPNQQSFEPRRRQLGLGDGTPSRPAELRVGDRVRHHVFGEGQVVSVEPQGDDQVVTVQFKGVGKKRLSAKMARLERV